MTGFLLDQNLPSQFAVIPSLLVKQVGEIANNPSDSEIWAYAKEHSWIIVSKDADFSERMMVSSPPPKVVHFRLGNLRLAEFIGFVSEIWPRIEILIQTHKLVNIYRDRLEAISDSPDPK